LAEITVIKWDLEKAELSDFKTTAPYAYLYSIQDPFVQNIRLEEMAAAAQKLGFRTFKKAYIEYKKSLKQGDARPDGNVTEFQKSPLDLNCGKWSATESGVYCESEYGPIEACSHPIEPVQRLINIDTDTEKLTLWYRRGNTTRSIIVEKSILASPQSIIKLADRGIGVTSETAKALIKYLADVESMNYTNIPEKRSVSRLGWIPKYGFSPYVDDLEFDGDPLDLPGHDYLLFSGHKLHKEFVLLRSLDDLICLLVIGFQGAVLGEDFRMLRPEDIERPLEVSIHIRSDQKGR